MLTYHFYLYDAINGYDFVGVLPERRGNQIRISDESIINWGRKYFGANVKIEDIFFVKVDLEVGEKGRFKVIYY